MNPLAQLIISQGLGDSSTVMISVKNENFTFDVTRKGDKKASMYTEKDITEDALV